MFGVTELFVLSAVAASLVVVALIWVRRPLPALSLERRVDPPQVVAGGTGRVEVAITNHGARRLPPISILDPVEGTVGARLAVGPLAPRSREEAGYQLPHLRRGQLLVGPLAAELTDPFGLARRRLPGVAEQAITVLPAIDPAPVLPVGGGRHEPLAGLSRRTAGASGVDDLVTLRPYVVGDDLRRVHWPSTARSDELQVRRDEERWQGHLAVLLDDRAGALDPEDFERAVSAAAGIVDAVAASGDRVRVATSTGSDSGMVDAARSGHQLLEDLALVRQTVTDQVAVPPADARRPAALVILTGPTDRATGRSIADAAAEAGFAESVVVRFGGDDAPDGVTVRPGEPLAAAWKRTALARVGS
jgi:uncharacterized protein (DUF58 family)